MKLPAPDRIVSDRKLTPEDFANLARERGVTPLRARKFGRIAARQAVTSERIDTHWNGKETSNIANAGDWIVTSLGADRRPLLDRDGNRNVYVILPARFPDLYEPDGRDMVEGQVYRAKANVQAIPVPGGFDILAPWGERQTGPSGYLILNGDEVYGNNAETFAANYEFV